MQKEKTKTPTIFKALLKFLGLDEEKKSITKTKKCTWCKSGCYLCNHTGAEPANVVLCENCDNEVMCGWIHTCGDKQTKGCHKIFCSKKCKRIHRSYCDFYPDEFKDKVLCRYCGNPTRENKRITCKVCRKAFCCLKCFEILCANCGV